MLHDVEVLTETVHSQANEIATLKFDNDKLLNLYQNKEKLLDQKRNELAEALENLEAVRFEKHDDLDDEQGIKTSNLLLKIMFTLADQHDLSQEVESLYFIIKTHQKEREVYIHKIKEAERALKQRNLDFYIMEEKDQIWKREREFYISQQSLLRAELENSRELVVRMENHVNMLNTLLLPHEYIQRVSSQTVTNLSDSDSSYDDMLKDYGAASIPKVSK